MSRGTTNVLSSNLGGKNQGESNLDRFESAFHTHDEATFYAARAGAPLSEAGLASKSNTGIGSGSHYVKPADLRPMLLSEHTFKGREQELSEFANRVATGHSGAAVLAEQPLQTPRDGDDTGKPGGTRRATDASEAAQMTHTYRELAGNAL